MYAKRFGFILLLFFVLLGQGTTTIHAEGNGQGTLVKDHITDTAFLEELESLGIAGDMDINNSAVHQVKSLTLNNSGITDIQGISIFKGLQYVTLDGVQITKLSTGSFADLASLKTLTISNSSLQVIEAEAFKNLPCLETLTLENNLIYEINAQAFSDFPEGVVLNLANNNLTEVNNEVYANLKLASLDLSGNLLKEITSTDFDNMAELMTLNLANNRIQTVDANGFTRLTNLKTIDLSYNYLTHFSDTYFSNNANIEYIDLLRNYISDLHEMGAYIYLNTNSNQNGMFRINYQNIIHKNPVVFQTGNQFASSEAPLLVGYDEEILDDFPNVSQFNYGLYKTVDGGIDRENITDYLIVKLIAGKLEYEVINNAFFDKEYLAIESDFWYEYDMNEPPKNYHHAHFIILQAVLSEDTAIRVLYDTTGYMDGQGQEIQIVDNNVYYASEVSNGPYVLDSRIAEIKSGSEIQESGRNFLHWVDDEGNIYEAGKEYDVVTGRSGDLVLKPVLVGENYTIYLHANNGSNKVLTQPAVYGEMVTLMDSDFTRPGYRKAGWSLSETGEVEIERMAEFTYEYEGDIHLYMIWQPLELSIRGLPKTVYVGDRFELEAVLVNPPEDPEPDPVKPAGWQYDNKYLESDTNNSGEFIAKEVGQTVVEFCCDKTGATGTSLVTILPRGAATNVLEAENLPLGVDNQILWFWGIVMIFSATTTFYLLKAKNGE